MKTKEELNTLKEEVETVSKKLAELTEEELSQVTGGNHEEPPEIPVLERPFVVLSDPVDIYHHAPEPIPEGPVVVLPDPEDTHHHLPGPIPGPVFPRN